MEISGGAASGILTAALQLVAEAQRDEGRYGFVAWVASTRSLFFPPDAECSGVEPERLVLVRVEGTEARIRAATHLAQTGAFGLVVVDLGDSERPRIGGPGAGVPGKVFRNGRPVRAIDRVPPLSRLSALVRRHGNAVVLLTAKGSGMPSLDPRIVKRYNASRRGKELVVTVIKDKGRGQAVLPADHKRSAAPPASASPVPALSVPSLPPGFLFRGVCREPPGLR